MTIKYIFVTGGVVSSVGKGVTTAAIGRLLKERGFSVAVQKLDPYINVDPGTMSPYQHGEVFVLNDGSETDLDLGHYERFVDINLSKVSTLTTGQVYAEVIAKERRGDYLGGTIQVIPQITDEIKRRVGMVPESTGAEIVLVEVGGTVGDIESLPFIEALRQIRTDVGRENIFYIHTTWLPHIGATNELKTKPTQHSVRELRSLGISPQMIIARADKTIAPDLTEKIAKFCDVDRRGVVPVPTIDVMYEIPLLLERLGVADYIVDTLGLQARHKPDLSAWEAISKSAHKDKPTVRIALVGKYVELHDAYLSVKEALVHAGLALGVEIEIDWIHASEVEKGRGWDEIYAADGILVPGGFDSRGIEGKIAAAKYARENKVPYFGLCLGMQIMAIEFARNVLGYGEANSTEFDPASPYPVIDLMPDQRGIAEKGATMRLGVYPCQLEPGSVAAAAYGQPVIEERHRHRYEFNNTAREAFAEHGMRFSGTSPDNRLVEIIEVAEHPYMLGTQFHPEFLSRPTRPHPLFAAFVRAAAERAGAKVELPASVSSSS
ncbi:MAG TPA: CTP synthase [Anaerolineales bacterium]|nr:CTP synthase [Anaerolineales bacterium]HRQ91544.1 CTP synthase [Anaerolineales bacterium]